uniref:Putative trna-binding protein n=1 Tax=Ornithodoros turicata TaxID=34597 RepID=A0A2R5LEL0_9ACAR
MVVEPALARVISRAKQLDELVASLKAQLQSLRALKADQYVQAESSRLRKENEVLRQEVEVWKDRLIQAEIRNGIEQIPPPSAIKKSQDAALAKPEPPVAIAGGGDEQKGQAKKRANAEKKANPPAKKEKGEEKKKPADDSDDKAADIARLDLRIGRIISAAKHPDADALYVEQVDVGEEKPRTVVSGLVKFVPLEELQGRLAVLLCNLKPAKMRGVTSEAMVMCASTPEKVEVLEPPPGSEPGDRVHCVEYPGQPDAQLNPKKKIFEQVAPDLKTNSDKVATYKGAAWRVQGKEGYIVAASLAGVQIK